MSTDFHRHDIAELVAQRILQPAETNAWASGVLLSAARRTGLSTFLREDLRPELERRGALVVYVDLGTDRKSDPGTMMVAAARSELARMQLGVDACLTTALSTLASKSGKPIVFIIDEAQHAITSARGVDALFALKDARARLKGLRIVAASSSKDKLAMLRSSADQAFCAVPLTSLPPLDEKFIEWLCERAGLPATLDAAAMHELLACASFQPERLKAAADSLRSEADLPAADVARRLQHAVNEQVEADNIKRLRVLHGLNPLQSAVLCVLVARGNAYVPFEPASMQAYRRVLDAIAPEAIKPNDSTVQQALIGLQAKGLVWRAGRGVYVLDDASVGELMRSEGMLDAVTPAPAPQVTS